jgi:hypothetical protein
MASLVQIYSVVTGDSTLLSHTALSRYSTSTPHLNFSPSQSLRHFPPPIHVRHSTVLQPAPSPFLVTVATPLSCRQYDITCNQSCLVSKPILLHALFPYPIRSALLHRSADPHFLSLMLRWSQEVLQMGVRQRLFSSPSPILRSSIISISIKRDGWQSPGEDSGNLSLKSVSQSTSQMHHVSSIE